MLVFVSKSIRASWSYTHKRMGKWRKSREFIGALWYLGLESEVNQKEVESTEWVWQNGGLDSSKLPSPTEKKKSEQKLSPLCQDSGKQPTVYSHQTNAEPKTRQLENGGKALFHFWLPLLHLPPWLTESWGAAWIPRAGPWSLASEGAEPLHNVLRLSVLICLRAAWRTDVNLSFLLHLRQNPFGAETWQTLLGNTVRPRKTHSHVGWKVMIETYS